MYILDGYTAVPSAGRPRVAMSRSLMCEEIAFSCSQGGGSGGLRVAAWDPSKGAVKRTYSCEAQGGGAALVLLGKTYLLCALKAMPFIYVWHLRKEQVHMKMACPGVVRTLAATPDAVHCAGAIAEKIYVWQVSTGRLLAEVARHYQPVSVLAFTDDGQWLISGGEDGRVLVWSLRQMLSDAFDSSGTTLPHCEGVSMATRPRPPVLHQTWSDHALPVSAVHCGAGGLRARVATASLDQTCRLYDLASGRLLVSLLFGFSLTAVAMDTAEQWLFVGGATGRIAQINLFLQRTSPAHDMSAGTDSNERFKGHTKAVTSLAVSSRGPSLMSSAEDGTCRVWDIASGQAIRIQQMKGAVTHSLLCWDTALPGTGRKGREGGGVREVAVSIAPFQKRLAYLREGAGLEDVQTVLHRTVDPLCDLESLDVEAGLSLGWPPSTQVGEGEEEMKIHRLREDLTRLREVNRVLYSMLTESSSPGAQQTHSPPPPASQQTHSPPPPASPHMQK